MGIGCTLSRRRFLVGAGALAAGAGLGRIAWADEAPTGTAPLTPAEALERLRAGNARFVADPEACTTDLAGRRRAVAASQAPWATVIACADSRVPPELLFGGLGLGELFVARNAGNLVDTATMGTVEYGAEVLGAPLLVVLGHEKCGAVAAACEVVTKNAKFPGSIGPMVRPIVPAATAMRGKPGDFVDNTVRESARRTAQRLAVASPILSKLVKEGKLKIVAARYDLDDGKVEYL